MWQASFIENENHVIILSWFLLHYAKLKPLYHGSFLAIASFRAKTPVYPFILSMPFTQWSCIIVIFLYRSFVSNSSRKRKRPGILGNNDESEGEVENLPSPGDDDSNVSKTYQHEVLLSS